MALTGRLVDEFGPRPAGSESARKTAAALLVEADQIADRTWTERFKCHPGAFLGWIRLLVIIYLVSTAFLWLEWYLPSAILVTVGLVIMVGQFLFYAEWIDPLYPEVEGQNVLAAIEPAGEVRGQLIVSGHHDSAYVFNFLANQPSLYALRVTGGIAAQLLLFLASWVLAIVKLSNGSAPGWGVIAAAFFTFLFLLVGQLWFFASSEATPGAGDNLASTAAAWEVLREIAKRRESGDGLSHLRVVAASWDAEEAGLRGARRWVQAASDGRLSIPTWNLNLECLYDTSEFFFLTSDVNGTVQLSKGLAERCQRLMQQNGHQVPAKPIAFLTGGTDAGELARGGAEATALIGMPWGNTNRSAVYHTKQDVLDAVSKEAVEQAIRLSVGLAFELDSELVQG